jgi:hypothetical protein
MDTRTEEPEPFLRVTIGTPIYTPDGVRLGKVKAIQARYFKVETSLFQRDYWLGADTVAQAVPGEEVLLKLDKTQVATQKQTGVPPAA